MASRYRYKDVLPFMAMVSVECSNVGVKTLFKAATLKGMNYYVFVFYTYALSSLVLLPLPLVFHRKTVLPPLKFSILCRIFLLGLLGLSAQMIGYKGIEYSSPTLSSAISNVTAAFTFILAVIFRYFSPAELMVSFLYTLSVVIIAAPICFISERNLSSWRLGSDIATVAIVYAGIFGPAFSTALHSWGVRVKGPVYVAIFKPLSIAIAASMGVMFLGDPLTTGCVVGAIIITTGFYAVIWGKAQEEDMSNEEDGIGSIIRSSSSSSNTPLLQSHKVEEM